MTRWPITDHLPGNVTVTAYFVGLMAFCYNLQNKCEIGFYGNTSKHSHSLDIAIYRNYETQVFPPQRVETSNFEGRLDLFVQKGSPPKNKEADVRFFNGAEFDAEYRLWGDNNDFRWLLDLEPTGIEIGKPNPQAVLTSRLFVSQGIFFTFLPTCSTFSDEAGSARFGHIARVVAANISLRKDEVLILRVPGDTQPDPMKAEPGITYQIVFNNECKKQGEKCEESDFEEVFDLLDASSFNLKQTGGYKDKAPDNPIPIPPKDQVQVRSNDAAPCMGAGFGGSGGFPPQQ